MFKKECISLLSFDAEQEDSVPDQYRDEPTITVLKAPLDILSRAYDSLGFVSAHPSKIKLLNLCRYYKLHSIEHQPQWTDKIFQRQLQISQCSHILSSPLSSQLNYSQPQQPLSRYSSLEQLLTLLFDQKFCQLDQVLQNPNAQQAVNSTKFKGDYFLEVVVRLTLIKQAYKPFFKGLIKKQWIDLYMLDSYGWSLFKGVVESKNVFLVVNYFSELYNRKRARLSSSIKELQTLLLSLPDFYLELEWQVTSFLPLVGFFAPSDVLRIWKQRGRMRVDFTLVGYKALSCKRRKMSFFLNERKEGEDQVLVANFEKGIYYNLYQQLSTEEFKKIIGDLIAGKTLKLDNRFHTLELAPYRSLLGNYQTMPLADFEALRYVVTAHYTSRQVEYNERSKQKQDLHVVSSKQQFFRQERAPFAPDKISQSQNSLSLNCWLAADCPLKLSDLIRIIHIFSGGNQIFSKVDKFFQNNTKDSKLLLEGFPAKLEIPINFTLCADLKIRQIRWGCNQEESFFAEWASLKKEARRIAQKTLQSPKKRSVITNFYVS